MKNYLITGGCSDIDKTVLDTLLENDKVYNIDIHSPEESRPNHIFIQHDLSDYKQVNTNY